MLGVVYNALNAVWGKGTVGDEGGYVVCSLLGAVCVMFFGVLDLVTMFAFVVRKISPLLLRI